MDEMVATKGKHGNCLAGFWGTHIFRTMDTCDGYLWCIASMLQILNFKREPGSTFHQVGPVDGHRTYLPIDRLYILKSFDIRLTQGNTHSAGKKQLRLFRESFG